MLWQQKFFDNSAFSGPPVLGQAGGTCALNPDGTTSCPPAGAAASTPTPAQVIGTQADSTPMVVGTAAFLALVGAVYLLLK
jgi:hypothetical protein